jgi:hypothetical protein
MAETEQQWIPPKLTVRALINPQSWAIYTAEQDREYVCALGPSQTAKRYAHLFAAAPDLYEAAEALLKSVNGLLRPSGSQNMVRAALAKARGETPNG